MSTVYREKCRQVHGGKEHQDWKEEENEEIALYCERGVRIPLYSRTCYMKCHTVIESVEVLL